MNIPHSVLRLAVAASLAVVAGLPALAAGPNARIADDARPMAPGAQFRVTYLLFSGRPNPTVTVLPGPVYEVVQKRLDSATATGRALAATADAPPALGYNGILVEQFHGDGTVSRQVVHGDALRIESAVAGQSTTATSPSAAGLEAALLSIGRSSGALDTALLDYIARAPKP